MCQSNMRKRLPVWLTKMQIQWKGQMTADVHRKYPNVYWPTQHTPWAWLVSPLLCQWGSWCCGPRCWYKDVGASRKSSWEKTNQLSKRVQNVPEHNEPNKTVQSTTGFYFWDATLFEGWRHCSAEKTQDISETYPMKRIFWLIVCLERCHTGIIICSFHSFKITGIACRPKVYP